MYMSETIRQVQNSSWNVYRALYENELRTFFSFFFCVFTFENNFSLFWVYHFGKFRGKIRKGGANLNSCPGRQKPTVRHWLSYSCLKVLMNNQGIPSFISIAINLCLKIFLKKLGVAILATMSFVFVQGKQMTLKIISPYSRKRSNFSPPLFQE